MYDHARFVDTLAQFTCALLTPYDVRAALMKLAAGVTEFLSLSGSGIMLPQRGKLQLDTCHGPVVAAIEETQVITQSGPSVDAYRSGEVVAVADLTTAAQRWPEYCSRAAQLKLTSMAGIPMARDGRPVGVLNLYSAERREWADSDLAAARVLATMASAYMSSADQHRRLVELNEQLETALATRVVVEQAKGMVAATLGCTTGEAFERLRRYARSRSASVRSVAEEVVANRLNL